MVDWISRIKREKKIISLILILFGFSMIMYTVSYSLYFLDLIINPESLAQMSFLEPTFLITSLLGILNSIFNIIVGTLLIILGKKIMK